MNDWNLSRFIPVFLIAGGVFLVLSLLALPLLLLALRFTRQSAPPDPVLTEGLRRNARRFSGLYEGIYTAAQQAQPDPEAYREWHIRLENLSADTAFYEAFRKQFPPADVTASRLSQLLEIISAAGICRGTETAHTASSATAEQYVYLGTGSLTPGMEYAVLKPRWSLNGETLQQGILTDKENLRHGTGL